MKYKRMLGCLAVSTLVSLASSAHALVGRNCEGTNLKVTTVELFNSTNYKPIAKWDIAKKKIYYANRVGKTVSLPANCTTDRKLSVPGVLSEQVKDGNFNVRFTIDPKPGNAANARRFYGKNLEKMALQFNIGLPGAVSYVYQQNEFANPRDMCGTNDGGNLASCGKQLHLLGQQVSYPLQVRACNITTNGVGAVNTVLGCKGDDILFQGELSFE